MRFPVCTAGIVVPETRLIAGCAQVTSAERVVDSRALSEGRQKRLSMSRASAAQTVLPLGDQPQAVHGWDQVLMAAFADPDRASGFLPQAEEAVRAHPGDGLILLLAATAALLDQNPERAQIFLKR